MKQITAFVEWLFHGPLQSVKIFVYFLVVAALGLGVEFLVDGELVPIQDDKFSGGEWALLGTVVLLIAGPLVIRWLYYRLP